MPFRTILENLVKCIEGATGAILTDWEGESVDHFSFADDYELKLLGAHKGIILNRIREIHKLFPDGDVHEAVITTDRHHVIIGAINSDYSLLLIVDRESLVHKAVYEFRQAMKVLKREIC